MMETVNDRVEQVINEMFDGNKVAFANKLGMPPTSMSNYFGKERRTKVPVSMIERIVTLLKVDPTWLLTGNPDSGVTSKGYEAIGMSSSHAPHDGCSAAVLSERVAALERLIKEKDARIALLERIAGIAPTDAEEETAATSV